MTWFTVATPSDVVARRRVIAQLRPGVRYRAVEITKGVVTVAGPDGSTGTIKRSAVVFERPVDQLRFEPPRRSRRGLVVALVVAVLAVTAAAGKFVLGQESGSGEEVVAPVIGDGRFIASKVLPNGGFAYVVVEIEGEAVVSAQVSYAAVAGANSEVCTGQVYLRTGPADAEDDGSETPFVSSLTAVDFVGNTAVLSGEYEAGSQSVDVACCLWLQYCPEFGVDSGPTAVTVDRGVGTVGFEFADLPDEVTVDGLELFDESLGVDVGKLLVECPSYELMVLSGLYEYPNGDVAGFLSWTSLGAVGASGYLDGEEVYVLTAVTPTAVVTIKIQLDDGHGIASVQFSDGTGVDGCEVELEDIEH